MVCADHRDDRCRVLLADDQLIVAAGVRALIEPSCDVVGIVKDGRSLLVEAERLRPDVIVMEVLLPLLNGLDAARQLTKLAPESGLMFLTVQESSRMVADAFKVGASAYLLKRSPASELSQAISAAQRGDYFLTSLLIKDMMVTNQSDATGVSVCTSVSSSRRVSERCCNSSRRGEGPKRWPRCSTSR